jgi:short-subunit dehydrogenase
MSESLRLETRPFGIHVVLVELGDFRTQITAKRCVAEASQNYRTAFDKFKRKQDQDEAAEPTPEPVARQVDRILSHRRPKARYTVGMLGQRIVAPLKRLLPRWWRGLRRSFRATNILLQRLSATIEYQPSK